ncbi:MAG: P-II family nitrogen regulator [Magnetococcales bacterium]|nr:P-II family nitrogen regulator [Magnetococcales bacterium]
MKHVTAMIKPFKFDDVREALINAGVSGVTASEVRGFGRQNGHTEIYRYAQYHVDLLPKIKIEIAVSNRLLDGVLKALQESSRTGRIGDGKIFITEIDKTVHIRTNEIGEQAL